MEGIKKKKHEKDEVEKTCITKLYNLSTSTSIKEASMAYSWFHYGGFALKKNKPTFLAVIVEKVLVTALNLQNYR